MLLPLPRHRRHRALPARRRSWPRPWAAAAVLPLVLASCATATPGSGGASGGRGDTLTVAQPLIPQTLDPAKTSTDNAWLEQLAYEPLIVQRPDGSLVSGLAASWQYQGTDNKTFVLHLRSGVKFADGADLTAQGVVDHLRYMAKGVLGPFLAGDTFTATDPLTVTIQAAQPNPEFPLLLTQRFNLGDVISPKGLQSPEKLGTQTSGAGRYQLDPAQTVPGDHYTYVANPKYYDTAAVHWQKVVVKIIGNAQATLNALKSGQADVALGDPSTSTAAGQAGLTVTSSPLLWIGAILADRNGKMAKPLADVRVRQALNFATDRTAITTALFRGIGTPTAQPTVPGGHGYDQALDATYPYDAAKAKQLLTDAGYPNGFAVAIGTPQTQSQNLVAQALAQQWKQVGVDLQISDFANAAQFAAAVRGAQTPAVMTAFGQLPLWLAGRALFLPTATWNPFRTADPDLQTLYDKEARSSGEQKTQLDRQIMARLVQQAWFVPVAATGLSFYARKTVTGTNTSAAAPNLYLYDIRPAS